MKITFRIGDNKTVALRNFNAAAYIIKLVCRELNVTASDLESSNRSWCYVWPRWLAIALLRRHTTLSLHQIGDLFNRDHVAILHAERGVRRQAETDPSALRTLNRLDELARAVPPISELVSIRPIHHRRSQEAA